MKTNRTITRENAMTILYQIFLYKKNKINYNVEEVIEEYMNDLDLEERKKINIEFLKELINGVLNNIENIDKNITKDYLEELKQYITPKSDIKEEEKRLNKIVSILSNRLEQRENLNNKLKEYSIEINLFQI